MGVEGTTLAGRYRLERLLAEGGMGQVWVARHLTLDIPVAVKLMSGAATLKNALRSRFELEAKAIAQLRSPNIVQILDYGTEQETPYIVMEMLEGSDLLALIPRRPRWPLPEIADLVTQVGKGLAAAHARGIIHRDIKPGNVFLSRAGTDSVIKLLDFGIAKWLASEQNLTETDAVLGSPYYMAPEQVRGETLDPRADLWALSVVAYRLATGSLPFEGRDAIEVAERVMVGAWKPVPASAPKAGQLQRFFTKAFAQQREGRFRSAAALTDAFLAITGPSSPAWTGGSAFGAGENTVTIVKPRASEPELMSDDPSITEVTQSSRAPFSYPEGETSTSLLPLSPLDQTTQRVRSVPIEQLRQHLAAHEAPSQPHAAGSPSLPRAAAPPSQPQAAAPPRQPQAAAPPSQPQAAAPPSQPFQPPPRASLDVPPPPISHPIQQQHDYQEPAPSSPGLVGPPPPWAAGWAGDPSDMLATTKLNHVPIEARGSSAMLDWAPARGRPSATVISLSLCATLVVGIGIWVAANVGSSSASDSASASGAPSTASPHLPEKAPPPPSPTTRVVSSSASSTASAATSAAPTKPPLSPKRPYPHTPPKSGSTPAFLHHK